MTQGSLSRLGEAFGKFRHTAAETIGGSIPVWTVSNRRRSIKDG